MKGSTESWEGGREGGREMEAHNLSKERRGKQILLKATREKREKTFL